MRGWRADRGFVREPIKGVGDTFSLGGGDVDAVAFVMLESWTKVKCSGGVLFP